MVTIPASFWAKTVSQWWRFAVVSGQKGDAKMRHMAHSQPTKHFALRQQVNFPPKAGSPAARPRSGDGVVMAWGVRPEV